MKNVGPIIVLLVLLHGWMKPENENFGQKITSTKIFFSTDFCRSDFFTKIFTVTILLPKEEKHYGPNIKTWYENQPEIFHRNKTIDDFAEKFLSISIHLELFFRCNPRSLTDTFDTVNRFLGTDAKLELFLFVKGSDHT